MITTCTKDGCPSIHSSACVFYEGPSLIYTGISTNDSVEIALQKLNDFLMTSIPNAGSDQISFEKEAFQIGHNLVVGNAIRNDAGVWVKAQADVLNNSGTIGIVSDVRDVNNFTYQFGGHLTGDWVDGTSYFLSTGVAGGIVPEENYSDGQVREFIGTGTPAGLLIELDLGDIQSPGVINGGERVPINEVTSYRSSFETSDGKVYAGYYLNNIITITRTIDGILENAINLSNLEADWTNRLSLTYI